jgi:hypothetical protein
MLLFLSAHILADNSLVNCPSDSGGCEAMSQEQIRNEAAILARLAAIKVPEDRLPALGTGMSINRVGLSALTKYDYGQTEPAARFCPPPSR